MDQAAKSLPPGAREVLERSSGGFGIYKYGRGYWVRMLTAIGLGILFLAAGAWAWRQLEAFSLPNRAYTVMMSQAVGTAPKAGETVTLLGELEGRPVTIATGVVESFASEGGRGGASLVLTNQQVTEGYAIVDARRIEGPSTGADPFLAQIDRTSGIPVVERVYVQGTVALLILLIGCFVIFRYVGRKPGSVDFLIATDEEMRKVNWSTRKVIIDSTYVVITATVLIAAFIFVWDLVLKRILLEQLVAL